MLWGCTIKGKKRTPMMHSGRIFWTCLAAMLIFAPPVAAQTIVPSHPLVGKIFDTRTGVLMELTNPSLGPMLCPADGITLLGEVHDNPAHHTLRANLFQPTGIGVGPRCDAAAYVFEHINTDQQSGLAKLAQFDKEARRLATSNDLFRFLEWDKSGWPPSRIFTPLIQNVVDSRRPILAGNPSPDDTRRVARQGLSALAPERVTSLGLDQPLDADLQDSLLTELEASHCGLMPKTAFGNMAASQRFKDAHMADVALKAARYGTTIIFAGNGHVRTDRGVPYYIRQQALGRKVVAVAFVETEDGKLDPAAYGPRDPAGKPAVDYVAFAAPAAREDPCEGMRAQFKAKP